MDPEEARSYIDPDRCYYPVVLQPPGSNQCGQAVVAMILSCSLEEAVQKVGKRGLTRIKDLKRAIETTHFTVQVPMRFITPGYTTMEDLPDTAIVKMKFFNSQGRMREHWCFWTRRTDGSSKLICPAHGIVAPELYPQLLSGHNMHHPWLTSYARVGPA